MSQKILEENGMIDLEQNKGIVEELFKTDRIAKDDAHFEALKLAFAPVSFQATIAMRDLGILELIKQNRRKGISQDDICEELNISPYGVNVLLTMGLSLNLVYFKNDKYYLGKVAYYILNDAVTKVNMDFVQDVCYKGLFDLTESIKQGKAVGLEVFGEWDTIYEALGSLSDDVRKSWFGFDHYYSDGSFNQALKTVLKEKPEMIYDFGGNTGKFALQCVGADDDIKMTILDLPGQLATAKKNIVGKKGAERISMIPINFLAEGGSIPKGADAIWMSQFLDCFSEDQIVSILKLAKTAMEEDTSLYIMETFWDRQKEEASTFCLNATSLYFTALANGDSRMYHSDAFVKCIDKAGLKVVEDLDNIGLSHTILRCQIK